MAEQIWEMFVLLLNILLHHIARDFNRAQFVYMHLRSVIMHCEITENINIYAPFDGQARYL